MTLKELLKAKELLEKQINLNNTLLDQILQIKADETRLYEENKAYKLALNLIIKTLREQYRKGEKYE